MDFLTTWGLRVMPEQISTTGIMEKCIIQFIVPELSSHERSCVAKVGLVDPTMPEAVDILTGIRLVVPLATP